MEWSHNVGRILFFAIPIGLWLIGCSIVRARGWDRALAFIVAGDNRLSLSRLQAFLWTLVIFGSFFSAMAVHSKIIAHTPGEIMEATAKLTKTKETAAKQEAELEKRQQELLTSQDAEDKAARLESEATSYDKSLAVDANASAASKTEAAQKLAVAKAAKAAAETARKNGELAVGSAQRAVAATNKIIEELQAKSFEWVVIPNALLALAGIAIGSGILSNLISAINSDSRAPALSDFAPLTALTAASQAKDQADAALARATAAANETRDRASADQAAAATAAAGGAADAAALAAAAQTSAAAATAAEGAKTAAATNANTVAAALKALADAYTPPLPPLRQEHQAFVIRGKDLGKSGAVRLMTGWGVNTSAEFSPELFWKDDGTEIVIEAPSAPYRTLIVDTPNGKCGHEICGVYPNLSLGTFKSCYELADLFRDDKVPSKYDLMKFQMFGWTVIAIFIYGYLFLRDLGPGIHSLPVVPESIVLLTGLSQVGYLGSKAVSNMDAKKTAA